MANAPWDPRGSGYDTETARRSGIQPDATGHYPSFDGRTGMLLKGMNHPTIGLTMEEERRRRNRVVQRADGRYYTEPMGPSSPPPWAPQSTVGPYGMTNAWLTDLVGKSAQSAGRAAYNSPGRYRDVQEIADEYEPIPPLEQMQFGPLKKAKRMRQGPRGSGGGRR